MKSEPISKREELSAVFCGMAWATTAFLVVSRITGLHPTLTSTAAIAGSALLGTLGFAGIVSSYRSGVVSRLELVSMSGMLFGAWFLVFLLASRLSQFVAIPADIVGFGENGFLDFILKFREGFPLYTPGPDNNTVPYTPGAPILTYLVASLLGAGTSIPLLRTITVATGALAGVVFAFGAANLASLVHGQRFTHKAVWVAAWAGLLVLMAFDGQFNLYLHTLHNDPAALLVGATAFWVMTRYALTGQSWLLVVMIILPSIGFMIKQSQLMWVVVFPLFLVIACRLRLALITLIGAGAVYALTLGIAWLVWGPDFFFWVFSALGAKEMSLMRIVYHFLAAGVLLAFLAVGGWKAALTQGRRPVLAVWVSSLLVLLLGIWTSGAVWVLNHLGPGAMMATCWLFSALVGIWSTIQKASSRMPWRASLQFASLALVIVATFAGLGHLADPQRKIPDDILRYIAETEAEFEGMKPERVMLDNGNWIYLRTGTLMKDRATPLAVHIGPNQSLMNLTMLDATKGRIRSGFYDKILVHEIDTPRTAYDFGKRGSGIPELIYEHYVETKRIAGVKGITQWWPTQMISEIVVFVRRDLNTARPVSGAVTPGK